MSQQWYVARDKKKVGPYSMEQLRAFVGQGQLALSDMILKDGEAKWVAASTVGGLFLEQPAAKQADDQRERTTPISIQALQLKAEAWIREQFHTNPQRVLIAGGGIAFGLVFVICLGCVGLLTIGGNGGRGSGESEGNGTTTNDRTAHEDELDKKVNAQMRKVTYDNARKIHRGMTESEVEAILGKSYDKVNDDGIGYTKTYHGFGQSEIYIIYTAGVVKEVGWVPPH
jgi:hypothetical protein